MSLVFTPKARIILQLGDQLIRNESIAVLELVKNSYDACASEVSLTLSGVGDPHTGEIVIEDDGNGMTAKTVKDVWLQVGTTHKKKQLEDKKFKSPCGRVPLGEKGIGRFGVHKLGKEIELVTKVKGGKEVVVKINWDDFDNDKLLSAIPITLKERTPEIFKDSASHGTRLTVRNLWNAWTRKSVRDTYRAITSLSSPFDGIKHFNVKFKTDRTDFLAGLLSYKDVKSHALFSADVLIRGKEIASLEYKFHPWPSMRELKSRTHTEANVPMRWKVKNEETKKREMVDIDLGKHAIGDVRLQLLIFDLESRILSLGVTDKSGLKEYLKTNGGVKVFRSGVRVYDYGEPGNDWLELDSARVNRPTVTLSNNIVIGSVDIDRKSSTELVEKTNREGFIENEAYRTLVDAINFAITRISAQRNIDKDKLRSHYSPTSTKAPVVGHLSLLREKIEQKLPPSPLRDELLESVSSIERDYKTITEVYIRSASAGLSMSIVIHEIEKIIAELIKVVEETHATDRIQSLTNHLGRLIEGYSGLIRRRSQKETNLTEILDQALWNIEFRLKAHHVHVDRAYTKRNAQETAVRCSPNLITSVIINIIDNSLWWLNYGAVQAKKLYVNVSDEMPDHLTVVIADNGPGFNLPTEEIVKPFISNKEG